MLHLYLSAQHIPKENSWLTQPHLVVWFGTKFIFADGLIGPSKESKYNAHGHRERERERERGLLPGRPVATVTIGAVDISSALRLRLTQAAK